MRPRPAAVTVAGMHLRSTLISLAVAGAGLLAVAPVAGADSIVYIDQGNVWTMKGDGTGRVQLTDGGRWHSPTQADDGTIAAVDGTGPIVVMTKDGRQLRTIQTPPAKSGDGGTFAPRPVSLAFSPDGSKIAYSYVAYSCPVASTCGTVQRSTFYSEAAGPDAHPDRPLGQRLRRRRSRVGHELARADHRRLREPHQLRRPRRRRRLQPQAVVRLG